LFVVDGQFQPSQLHVLSVFVRESVGVMIEDDGEFLGASRLVEKVNCKLLALASEFLCSKATQMTE
jgi:hypothetical protein